VVQIGDWQAKLLGGQRDELVVRQQPGRDDRFPQRTVVRGERRDGLLSQRLRQQRPQPASARPSRFHHGGTMSLAKWWRGAIRARAGSLQHAPECAIHVDVEAPASVLEPSSYVEANQVEEEQRSKTGG